MRQTPGRSGHAGDADRAAGADGAARHPGLHDPRRIVAAGPVAARGARVVGLARDRPGRGERRRRRDLGRRRRSAAAPAAGAWRALDASLGRPTPGEHELCCRATDAAGNVQPRRAAVEPRRLHEQRGAARRRDRSPDYHGEDADRGPVRARRHPLPASRRRRLGLLLAARSRGRRRRDRFRRDPRGRAAAGGTPSAASATRRRTSAPPRRGRCACSARSAARAVHSTAPGRPVPRRAGAARRRSWRARWRGARGRQVYAAWAGIGHPDHGSGATRGSRCTEHGMPVTIYTDYCYCTREGWPTWIDPDGPAQADEQWRDSFGHAVGSRLTAPRVDRLTEERSRMKLAAMRGYVTQYGNVELEEPSWQLDGRPPGDPEKRAIEVFYRPTPMRNAPGSSRADAIRSAIQVGTQDRSRWRRGTLGSRPVTWWRSTSVRPRQTGPQSTSTWHRSRSSSPGRHLCHGDRVVDRRPRHVRVRPAVVVDQLRRQPAGHPAPPDPVVWSRVNSA